MLRIRFNSFASSSSPQLQLTDHVLNDDTKKGIPTWQVVFQNKFTCFD